MGDTCFNFLILLPKYFCQFCKSHSPINAGAPKSIACNPVVTIYLLFVNFKHLLNCEHLTELNVKERKASLVYIAKLGKLNKSKNFLQLFRLSKTLFKISPNRTLALNQVIFFSLALLIFSEYYENHLQPTESLARAWSAAGCFHFRY